MARPKQDKDARSEIVGVRLTLTERQELEARANGVPLSTFLRTAGLRRSLSRPIPAVNLQTYQALLQLNLAAEQIKQTLMRLVNDPQSVEQQAVQHQLSLLQELKVELRQISKAVLAVAPSEQTDEAIYEGEYDL